jgi:hypothetical protein
LARKSAGGAAVENLITVSAEAPGDRSRAAPATVAAMPTAARRVKTDAMVSPPLE